MIIGYSLVMKGVLENATYFEGPYFYNPRFMEIQQLDPVFRLFWERNFIGIFLFTLVLISMFGNYVLTNSNHGIISKKTDKILHSIIFMLVLVGIASFTLFYDFNVLAPYLI